MTSEYLVSLQEGFVYHHAETGYVVLTFWLPDEQPCMLPSTGSHQIGIGAFVINENKEVISFLFSFNHKVKHDIPE